MFEWLKKIFRKKEDKPAEEPVKATEQDIQQAMKEVPEREIEEDGPAQRMEKMAAREKELSTDPHRPEKICAKCGAPNDKFVNVCWMCKERV